jgi:hypothetical protein
MQAMLHLEAMAGVICSSNSWQCECTAQGRQRHSRGNDDQQDFVHQSTHLMRIALLHTVNQLIYIQYQ